jgi:hypothetical protein
MSTYPPSCLRAIEKKSQLLGKNMVHPSLFEPDTRTLRSDGYIDTSVNWEDDTSAIEITKRNGNCHYGIARLSTHDIEQLIEQNAEMDDTRNTIICEKDPILPDNPYHGNLRFLTGVPNTIRSMLLHHLARRARIAFRTNRTD